MPVHRSMEPPFSATTKVVLQSRPLVSRQPFRIVSCTALQEHVETLILTRLMLYVWRAVATAIRAPAVLSTKAKPAVMTAVVTAVSLKVVR